MIIKKQDSYLKCSYDLRKSFISGPTKRLLCKLTEKDILTTTLVKILGKCKYLFWIYLNVYVAWITNVITCIVTQKDTLQNFTSALFSKNFNFTLELQWNRNA